uniref:Beta/gamma crystallin 'Greek key' domain-containing protein n=1 Tax=Buteo japonicus TaxID=224669 RepID=A0A8C0BK37_9AVES
MQHLTTHHEGTETFNHYFLLTLCKHLYCRSFFYEDKSFWGQMLEFTDNCPSVPGYIHLPEICSLNVLGGSWILYEMEYRRVLDCGAVNAKIVSLQRMTDLH